jgi:phosphomannomutase
MVVTRDGRSSGPMLAAAVQSGLLAVGRDVWYGDIAATPTTGVLVRQHVAAGGVQISASHNPFEYNGIKLFGGDGGVISADAGERVANGFHGKPPIWSGVNGIGELRQLTDTTSRHLELVLATVDVAAIRKLRYRVLLDSTRGAGSILGRRLLDELGCETTCVGATPDGQFEHPPEPTAENLASACEAVRGAGAAIGFCQDPDADRLAIIDESGRYIGEEYTLALCVDHVLRYSPGTVATNCSTSRMTADLAMKYGVECHTSRVGEANVTGEMRRRKAVFGGEGNGGPIDPRVGYVRDSFVGMALVLDAMARRAMPVSALADELPRYAIEKTKVTLAPDRFEVAAERLGKRFADAAISRLDGLRFDWADRWLLIRASNTEPIVRIIAEAPTADQAREMCQQAHAAIIA